jgi:mycothiol synthase
VRGESSMSVGDVRGWWRTTDIERNTWVVELGNEIVGAATLWSHGDGPNSWGEVHPAHRGRGFGSALLERIEARARDLGAGVVRTDAFAADEHALRLLASRGYRDVRHYYEMRIELGEEPPPEPEWPEGIVVHPFRLEDAREFHAANMEAFADEWGFVPSPFEEWREARLGAEDFDPSLWAVARDGDAIAGFVRCEPMRYGAPWVGALGVLAPWRRRGLGLALLRHAFHLFHARGERAVGLGVDAENPAGAKRVYERTGMHVVLELVTFEKALP